MLVYQIAVSGVNASSNIGVVNLSHVWNRLLPGDEITGAVIISGTNSVYTPGTDVIGAFFDHIVKPASIVSNDYDSNSFYLLQVQGGDLSNAEIAITLQRND